MKKEVEVCDICDADAILKLAVASYRNDRGAKFYCCEKHMANAVEAGCKIEIFSKKSGDGEVEFGDGVLYLL